MFLITEYCTDVLIDQLGLAKWRVHFISKIYYSTCLSPLFYLLISNNHFHLKLFLSAVGYPMESLVLQLLLLLIKVFVAFIDQFRFLRYIELQYLRILGLYVIDFSSFPIQVMMFSSGTYVV